MMLVSFASLNLIFASFPICNSIYKTPVKIWQKISYSTPILDCQFEPSCSNYFIHAVDSIGIVSGTIIGADRIIRCNPAARHYHHQKQNPKFHHDNRLINYVSINRNKYPNSQFVKYSIIPGLGRYKSGREIDALFSFLMVAGSYYNSYKFQKNHPNISGFYFVIGSIFWAADFYGTWRTNNSK
jgi:putative component of membrane protein insertase Oxa1/YidC/SpoIIIJ protein YidD